MPCGEVTEQHTQSQDGSQQISGLEFTETTRTYDYIRRSPPLAIVTFATPCPYRIHFKKGSRNCPDGMARMARMAVSGSHLVIRYNIFLTHLDHLQPSPHALQSSSVLGQHHHYWGISSPLSLIPRQVQNLPLFVVPSLSFYARMSPLRWSDYAKLMRDLKSWTTAAFRKPLLHYKKSAILPPGELVGSLLSIHGLPV